MELYYKMKIKIKIVFSFLCVVFLATSCIIVKEKSEDISDIEPMAVLSPKPEIQMSDIIVRSYKGDMVSYIPVDWFFIDVEQRVSPDIISVVSNPDYSLSAVFSIIKHSDAFDEEFEKDGLFGLARASYARRERKTAGAVKLIGKYQSLQIGSKEFVKYEFSTTGGATSGTTAVFVSSIGEFYEFSLIPMDITGNPIPDEKEFDKIFRSFLASIQY